MATKTTSAKTRSARRIGGRTDKVVIVGAGLAGLSAALYLQGSGRSVTVLERSPTIGGRVGIFQGRGYQIDTGATVLTMPNLVDDALAAVGASAHSLPRPLRLQRLDPTYHARFADGSTINVHSDPEAMAREVTRVAGAAESDGYLRLRSWLARIFELEFDRFIGSNFDSPLDLVSSRAALLDTLSLTALGGFGRLGPNVGRFISDPRLRRLFTFQSLYAGLSPSKALAVYGAIPHMDTSLGVYFPEGGMHRIPLAMADAFTGAGGILLTGTDVETVDFQSRRASGVRTRDGRRFACDALVLTADLPIVDELLPRGHGRARRTRWSPSAVVIHGTVPSEVTAGWAVQDHHTIDFGAAWEQTFTEITAGRGRGSLMSDPSLLLTRPGLTDPALNPPGRDVVSVLAPCPNLDSAPMDWATLGAPYGQEILRELERRGYHGISTALQVDQLDTPQTWADRGMGAGSPFSAAHTFAQTGPFRRSNLVPRLDNVVLAGCGTTPGVGVPTVLVSGRLAAERITG